MLWSRGEYAFIKIGFLRRHQIIKLLVGFCVGMQNVMNLPSSVFRVLHLEEIKAQQQFISHQTH